MYSYWIVYSCSRVFCGSIVGAPGTRGPTIENCVPGRREEFRYWGWRLSSILIPVSCVVPDFPDSARPTSSDFPDPVPDPVRVPVSAERRRRVVYAWTEVLSRVFE